MSKLTIKIVVDAVGALASGRLDGNLFLFDTNRRGGSTGQGTAALQSIVPAGAEVTWMVMPLECEAYANLKSLEIDGAAYAVERRVFPGTNIVYWTGRARKDAGPISYGLTIEIGHSGLTMSTGPTAGLRPAHHASQGVPA